jgi:hypothetical protein
MKISTSLIQTKVCQETHQQEEVEEVHQEVEEAAHQEVEVEEEEAVVVVEDYHQLYQQPCLL